MIDYILIILNYTQILINENYISAIIFYFLFCFLFFFLSIPGGIIISLASGFFFGFYIGFLINIISITLGSLFLMAFLTLRTTSKEVHPSGLSIIKISPFKKSYFSFTSKTMHIQLRSIQQSYNRKKSKLIYFF